MLGIITLPLIRPILSYTLITSLIMPTQVTAMGFARLIEGNPFQQNGLREF